MRFHASGERPLTIATMRENVPISLGVIEHDGLRVTDYVEKPTLTYDVDMGVYVYDPACWNSSRSALRLPRCRHA